MLHYPFSNPIYMAQTLRWSKPQRPTRRDCYRKGELSTALIQPRFLPHRLRKQMLNPVYNKDWDLLSQWLEQAHITEALKDANINAAHGAGEIKAN